MQISFFDLLCPAGHIRLNEVILRQLATLGEVKGVMDARLEAGFDVPPGVDISFSPDMRMRQGKILSRLDALSNMRLAACMPGVLDGIIFISSFDPLAYAFAPEVLKSRRCYLLHHRSVDEVSTNGIKRSFFDAYKNRVHHIVFEEFIADQLTGPLAVDRGLVHLVPHPVTDALPTARKGRYRAVGLSGSNDERLVEGVIRYEEDTGVFKNAGIGVYLKSKVASYDDGYLTVSNRRLPQDEYLKLCASAEVFVFPFPSSFRYRESATLLSSLACGRRAVASPFLMAEAYADRFPGLIRICDDPEDYARLILETLTEANDDETQAHFERIRARHSDASVLASLRDALLA